MALAIVSMKLCELIIFGHFLSYHIVYHQVSKLNFAN